MSGAAILKAAKLTRPGIIRVAAKHNKREIQAELGAGGPIDASRCGLNECLNGPATADEVASHARALMAGAGLVKVRKDAVRAIEFMVSLAPGTCVDERAFFADAVRWLADRFGGAGNILSADIHRDEPHTHMHLLMLPLIGGRMVGSDAFGGRLEYGQMLDDFYTEVCARYGLKRPPPKLAGAAKYAAVTAVMDELKRRRDPCLTSAAWSVIRDHIKANPGPYVDALGLEVAAVIKPKKLRSMTAIFTSKGKGSSKPEPDMYPMGFATPAPLKNTMGFATPAKHRTPSCVGFASSAALSAASPALALTFEEAVDAAPPAAPLPARPAPVATPAIACKAVAPPDELPDEPPDAVRERDADFAAGTWNADTGEFQTARVKAQSNKASARDWVAQALREVTAARGGGGGPGANRHPSNDA